MPLHNKGPTGLNKTLPGVDLSALLTQEKDAPPAPVKHTGSSVKGVYIGESLPPVRAKLAKKIRAR